jgi:hypothetical protein
MTSFTEAVAAGAGVAEDEARRAMLRLGIEAQPQPSSPGSLQVTRLAFTGTKRLQGQAEEAVDFVWDFEPGVTAISSEANLVGKSSILWLIRWGLVGSRPSDLTPEVLSWIDHVTLHGAVAGQQFVVEWQHDGPEISGSLTVANRAAVIFTSHTAFEESMSALMLGGLNLRAMPSWQKLPGGEGDEGVHAQHGWAAQFHALLIRGDKVGVLLGEHTADGQAQMLLQIFLGLPWAYTHRAASTALKAQRYQLQGAARRAKADTEARAASMGPIRDRLKEIDSELAALDRAAAAIAPEEADRRGQAYASATTRVSQTLELLAEAQRAVAILRTEADEAVKRMRAAHEDAVIVPLIGRVQPVACPRCSTGFALERLSVEIERHQCSVCDEPLPVPADVAAITAAATATASTAAAALAAAEQRDAELSEQHHVARGDLVSARAAIDEIGRSAPQAAQRRALEIERATLRGRAQQANASGGAVEPTPSIEQRVADAAVKEAERRRKDASVELLRELGSEIVTVAKSFGLVNLEEARPDLGAHLGLTIAGNATKFGDRTPGEKLRLKIALVVALLRVAERLHVGRHPGLVMIDSPGGEEMVDDNVASVLSEMQALCTDMPGLQILIASAKADDVRATVPPERIIHGDDWGAVW